MLVLIGEHASVTDVLAVEAALSVLRAAAFFTPSGLGVQDAATVALFQAMGMVDPLAVGAAFVVVKRVKEFFFVLVGMTVLVASSSSRPPQRREDLVLAP